MDNEPSGTDGMTAADRAAPKQTEWRKYSKTLIEELKKKLEDRRTRTLELLSENRDLVAFQEIDTESDGLDDTSTNVTLKHETPRDQHGLAEHLLALYENSSMTESDCCDDLDSKLSDCPYSVDVVRCEGECTHSSYSTTTSASCDSLISENEDEGLEFGKPVINEVDGLYDVQERASIDKLPLFNENPDAGDTCGVTGNRIRGLCGDHAREVNAVSPRASFIDQIFTRDILKSSLHSDISTKDSSLENPGELSVRLTESFTNLLGVSFTDDLVNNQLVGNGDAVDVVKGHNNDDDMVQGERGNYQVEKLVSEDLNKESEVNSNHLNNPCPMGNISNNDPVNHVELECRTGDVVDEAKTRDQLFSFESNDIFADMKKCRPRDEDEIDDKSAQNECIGRLFENDAVETVNSKETDKFEIELCCGNEQWDIHEDRRQCDIFPNQNDPFDSETIENNHLDRVDKVKDIFEERRTTEEGNKPSTVFVDADDKQSDLKEVSANDTQMNAQTDVMCHSFVDKMSKDVLYSSKVTLDEIFEILKTNTCLHSDVDQDIIALLETCVAEISAFQNISSNSGYPSLSRDGWPASLSSAATSQLLSQFSSDCDPIVRKRHLNACLEKAQLANALQKKIGRMNNRVENLAAERAYEKAVGDFEDIMSEFFKTYSSCPDDLAIPESKSHSPRSPRLPQSQATQKRALSRSNTFVIDKAKSRSPNRATTSTQFLKPGRAEVPKTKKYKTGKCVNVECDDSEMALPQTASPTFFVLQERNSLFPTKEKEQKRHKKPSRKKPEKVKLLSRSQRTRDSGTFIIHSPRRDSNTSSESETSDSVTENPETDTCQYTSSMLTQLLDYDSQEDEVTTKENDNEVYCSDTSGVFSKTTEKETLNDVKVTAEKTTKADSFGAAADVGKEASGIKDPDAGDISAQGVIQIEEDEQVNYESDFNAESISEVIQIEEDPDAREEECYVEEMDLEQSAISREPLATIDTGNTGSYSNDKEELGDQRTEDKEHVIENNSEDISTSLKHCVGSNECNETVIKSPSTIQEIDVLYEFSKNLSQFSVDLSNTVQESLVDATMNLDRPSADPAEESPSASGWSPCGINSTVDKMPHVSRPSHRKWLLKTDNLHNDLDDITAQFVPTVDWTSSDEDLIDDLQRDKSPSDILKKKQKEIVDEKLKQLTQISKRKRKSRSPVRYRSSNQIGSSQLENLARDLGLKDMSWTAAHDFQDPSSCFASLGEISMMAVEGRSKTHDPTRPSVSQLLLARIDEESNENAAEVFDDPLDINKEELSGRQLIIQTHERSKAVGTTAESVVKIQVGLSPSRPKPPSTYSVESPTKPVGSYNAGNQNIKNQPSTGAHSLTISGDILSSVSSTSGEFILPTLSNSLLLNKSETALKSPHGEFSNDTESFVLKKGQTLHQVSETFARDRSKHLDDILSSTADGDAVDQPKGELTWHINDEQHSRHSDGKSVQDNSQISKNHATTVQSLAANENVVREVTTIESKITCSNPELFIALSDHGGSILHENEQSDQIKHQGDIGHLRMNLNSVHDNAGTRGEAVPSIISQDNHLDPAHVDCPVHPSVKETDQLTASGIQENIYLQTKDKMQSVRKSSYENECTGSMGDEDSKDISKNSFNDWLFLGEGNDFTQHLDMSRSLKFKKHCVYKVVNPEMFQLSCSPSPLKQCSSNPKPQRNLNVKNLTREKVSEAEYVPTIPVHRRLDQHRRYAQRHHLRQDGLYFSHWEEDGSPKSSDPHRVAPRQSNFAIPVRNDHATAKMTSELQQNPCLKTDNSTLLALCDKLTSLEQLLTTTNTVPEHRDCYGTQQSAAYKQVASRAVLAHTKPEAPTPCSCSFEPVCPSVVCTCCGCRECRRACSTMAKKLCGEVGKTSGTRAIPEQSSVVKSSSKSTQTDGCNPSNLALINQNQSTQTKDSEQPPPCVKPEDIQLLAHQIKEMQSDFRDMKVYQASVGDSLDRLERNVGCELQRVAAKLKTEVGDSISQAHDHVTQVLTSHWAATVERFNQSVSATMSTHQQCLTQQGAEINKLVVTLQESKSGVDSKEQSTKKGMDYDTLKMRVVELTSQRDAEKVFHKITRESLRALERDHDRLRQEYIRATYRRANLGTESGVRQRLLDLLAEKDELPTQRNRHRHERDAHAKYRSRHTTDNTRRAGDPGCTHDGDQATAFKPRPNPRQYPLVNKTAGEVLLDSSEHHKKYTSLDKKCLTKSKQFFNTSPVSERNNHQRTYVSCEVLNLMPKHSRPDRSNQHQEHQGEMLTAGEALADHENSSLERQLTDQMTSVRETLAKGGQATSWRYHEEENSKKLCSPPAIKSSETADVKLHAGATSTGQLESCPVTDATRSANTDNIPNSILTAEDICSTTAVTDRPLSQNTNNSPGYLTDKPRVEESETADHKPDASDVGSTESKSSLVLSGESF